MHTNQLNPKALEKYFHSINTLMATVVNDFVPGDIAIWKPYDRKRANNKSIVLILIRLGFFKVIFFFGETEGVHLISLYFQKEQI